MTEKTCKVGDVVAWADVPDGAMVRRSSVSGETAMFYLRIGERGWCIGGCPNGSHCGAEDSYWEPFSQRECWEWMRKGAQPEVTIVSLDLTGQETAADLQRLAEVFEVREALDAMLTCPYCDNEEPTFETFEDGTVSQPWCTECDTEMGDPHLAAETERLHALGWRKGMTADAAARLLANADE